MTFTRASDSLTTILCHMPHPVGYQLSPIEGEPKTGGKLGASVIYRLQHARGHVQPMSFELRRTSPGWRIDSISLPQG